MPIELENGIKVAAYSELKDLMNQVSSIESSLQSRISSVLSEVSRLDSSLQSVARVVASNREDVSRDLAQTGSKIADLASALKHASASIASDLRNDLATTWTRHATAIADGLTEVAAKVEALAEQQEREVQDVVQPAVEAVTEAVAAFEEASTEASRELSARLSLVGEALADEIRAEQRALAELHRTTEQLDATADRSIQAVLGLERTFDRYQSQSLERTRIREAIEAGAFLETGRKELAAHGYSRALQMFTEAEKRLPPGDVRPAVGKASARIGLGELSVARDILEEARQKNPQHPSLLSTLARLHLSLGDTDRAAALLESFQADGGRPEEAFGADVCWYYKLLGVTLYHSQRVEEAFAALRRATEVDRYGDPELKAILVRLGEIDDQLPEGAVGVPLKGRTAHGTH